MAEIMNSSRGCVTAYPPQLDIDNAARTDIDRCARLFVIMDAFIEADWSIELALKLGVRVYVVPAERLLNHDQINSSSCFKRGASFSV